MELNQLPCTLISAENVLIDLCSLAESLPESRPRPSMNRARLLPMPQVISAQPTWQNGYCSGGNIQISNILSVSLHDVMLCCVVYPHAHWQWGGKGYLPVYKWVMRCSLPSFKPSPRLLQIFCTFLFLSGVCVFGTIISKTNRWRPTWWDGRSGRLRFDVLNGV
jgi:hypothetical protein